jgi:hypothetical protein
VKGSVQWYVARTDPGLVADVLACCETAGLTLAHPRTGVVTYLDDEPGKEGDQVATTHGELAATVDRRLGAARACVVQQWLEEEVDVLCTIRRVVGWASTLFDFDFDGLTADDAARVATILFQARQLLEHPTTLWLVESVGLGVEHGPAHEWDGAQAPAWPVSN